MTTMQATGLSDKDLIMNILNNYFIVDYGYINKVNPDKTVNITHAAKPVLMDGTELGETTTDNVEVLTISGGGFSIQWDYKAKDKVLILGLKDYVPKVNSVEKAEVPKAFIHYDRSTIKCIPLCIFSEKAKVVVDIKDGNMDVKTKGKIKLNGDSKQFVTWTELNTALTQYASLMSTALLGANVDVLGTPVLLTWKDGNPPSAIDISAAKTTTVVTGG
ncbi:MAG: hypothetical protein IKY09_07635 [Methanocorpusculum sp.]|nr:hypothetical protein [Methanocorpusculum sp.]MBR5450183.1 hypothetical protein [Methanocorpusculum sp.]